jgi:hypothetical protein
VQAFDQGVVQKLTRVYQIKTKSSLWDRFVKTVSCVGLAPPAIDTKHTTHTHTPLAFHPRLLVFAI